MVFKLFLDKQTFGWKRCGTAHFFLSLILLVGMIVLIRPAMALEVTIPWTVDLSIPAPSPPFEASWGESIVAPTPFGYSTYDLSFPTEHSPSFEVHLPFQITYTYPDIVVPGEVVAIQADWSFTAQPSFVANNSVHYSTALGMSIPDDDGVLRSFPLADIGELSLVPTPLSGDANWSESTTIAQDAIYTNTYSYDHFGNPWNIPPTIPGLEELAQVPGALFETSHIETAWNVPRIEILDLMGPALPGASLVGAIYDLYMEGIGQISDQSFFRTGTMASYLTYEGVDGFGYDLITNSNSLDFYLTVPDDIGLGDGDVFEVQIAALGLDYSWSNLYSVLAYFEYGVEFLSFLDVAGFTIDRGNPFVLPYEYDYVAGFYDLERYVESLNGDTILNFTVASSTPEAPVPEPSTIVLMGLGLIGLAGFGRKKFRK